jgi:uncharacterized protein YbcI
VKLVDAVLRLIPLSFLTLARFPSWSRCSRRAISAWPHVAFCNPAVATSGARGRSAMSIDEDAYPSHGDVSDASTGTLREISRAMVRIYKEQFGRGPETVWTRYSGPDAITSILRNSLTPVERSMLNMGEEHRLRDIRTMFQHATEPAFRAEVERITGRRVIGFMSGIDVHHDISCEVFTFEPRQSAS